MTQELTVTTENFRDIPVRIIQTEKDRLVPLNDIAEGLGYNRDSLKKIIRRNQDQFKSYSVTAILAATDGKQYETLCMTRDGITGIIMRLRTDKVRDSTRKKRVLDFQHWVMDTIGKVMDGKIIKTRNEDLMSILNCHMQIAKMVSDYGGVNPSIAATVAIARTEYLTGEDLSWCKGLIPGNKSLHPGHLNATEIGQKIGKTSRVVNQILYELGYQIKVAKDWKITIAGSMYGEMMPFTTHNGHSGYQPLWDPDIVEKIKVFDPDKRDGKNGRIEGYLT